MATWWGFTKPPGHSLDLAVVGPHHGALESLICRFVAGYFQDTVQLDTAQLFRTVKIHGKKVKLGIAMLGKNDGIMHVYDITTGYDAREFLGDAERECYLCLEDERTSVLLSMPVRMLVGACCDLEARRRVSKEQGRAWAVGCDCRFMEVSAKTGLNVDRAFYTLARDCLIKQNLLDKRVALQQVPWYQTRLTDACESGDFESVLDLLSEGCNPNCMGYTTPLHCACRHNLPIETIKQLLKHCNPAERDWYGNTPLHIAAQLGHIDTVKYLVSEGHCDPNNTIINGQNCLHLVCKVDHEKVMQCQLKKPACDVDASGRNCPHWVCKSRLLSVLQYLISIRHCNPGVRDSSGKNCLHHACEAGCEYLVDYLLSKTKCSIKKGSDLGRKCLRHACYFGFLNMVKYLVSDRDYDPNCYTDDRSGRQRNCLHIVCARGHLEVVKYLASVMQCDPNCLHIACEAGCIEIIKYLVIERQCDPNMYVKDDQHDDLNCLQRACSHNRADVVKFLISQPQCDVKKTDYPVGNCLFWACKNGHLQIVKYLVTVRHCNPYAAIPSCNFISSDGSVAESESYTRQRENYVHVAISNAQRDIVEYLLVESECDVSYRDKTGWTYLHWACKIGLLDVIKYLIVNRHCNPNDRDAKGQNCLHIAFSAGFINVVEYLLDETECSAMDRDARGRNWLHVACIAGKIDVLKYLINDRGCDPNYPDAKGRNCLHIASDANKTDIVEFLVCGNHCNPNDKDMEGQTCLHLAYQRWNSVIVKYLVRCGTVDVNEKDKNGGNCLLWACEVGSIDIVRYLITGRHCDTTVTNPQGQNCLHIACQQGFIDIVKFLISGNYCNPNSKDKDGQNSLHTAYCCAKNDYKRYIEIVKYLTSIEAPLCCVNVDEKDKNGSNCLLWACRVGLIDIMRYLITERHCDTTVTNPQGQNCLHIACQQSCIDIVKFLVSGNYCNPNSKDKDGQNSLHTAYCCIKNNFHMVEYLISVAAPSCCVKVDEKDKNGSNCLLWACKVGSIGIVRYLITERHCDTTVTNPQGQNCLHIACQQSCIDIVKFLVSGNYCNPNSKDKDGQNSLHTAYCCIKNNFHMVEYLISVAAPSCCVKVDEKDKNGSNCLLWACKVGSIGIVRYLITERHCDTTVTNPQGQNCLHIACQEGRIDIVKLLVSGNYCNPNSKDRDGQNSLHTAYCCAKNDYKRYIEIVKYLTSIEAPLCCVNVDEKDKNGRTCLQWACEAGYIDVVEVLISCEHCNVGECGQRCLQLACRHDRADIVRILISQGHCDPFARNEIGSTWLHVAAAACESVKVVRYLVDEVGIDPSSTDNLDQTPLHRAAREGYYDVVRYLLSTGRVDIFLQDSHGNTALDLAKSMKVVELISDAEIKLKQRLLPQKPPEPSVSVFIVGNHSVGKSTLVAAFTREASGLSALPGFFLNVSVDPQTAGIIPTDFVSKIYGRVTFFDLAGQNQYYASHAAVIQNAISSAAPVFLLVVKLPEAEEDIKQQIFYWLVFLENQCKKMEAKPHIIIVGSHADRSQAVEEPTRRRIWECFQTISCCKSFSLIDFIPLDCRKSESAGVSQLRQRLKTSCDALRREESMEIYTHCLFVFLVQKVSAVLAISLQQLTEAIRIGKLNQGPLQHEDLLQPDNLYKMCDKLHACGHILFLKNEINPEDSWIIMNKEALLSHVTGTIFAPKQFKEHREDLASSTGVVPFSKLAAYFPDFNMEMIVQFLTHLEFCHEVSDREVVEMINKHEKESSRSVPATVTAHDLPSEIPERYFFFPALVSVETPITPLWEEDGRFTHQSGWLLRCSRPEHFFTPRFLQVLLLRLAFSFALAPDRCNFQVDLPVLRRKCSIWKNGIYWVNMDGVASLVEMDRHNRELYIIMRCLNGREVKCAKLRSAIIHNVLRAVKEFCPKIDALEYLIHTADIQYPLPQSRELILFSINSVAEAILQSLPVVVNDEQKLATIEELLYFEPYANVGEVIVSELFDEQNPSYSAVVSDGFLYTIADRVHPRQSLFEKMLDLSKSSVEFYQSQAPPGPAHAMGHLLVCWKEHSDGSRLCLRQKLDQFSVFAGRSPLQLVSTCTHAVFSNVVSFDQC